MATQWQKSCIEALVTSPIAFKLFKIEQRNIKMMDQFLDRIWPYKMVEIPISGILNQIGHKTTGKKKKEYKSINIGIEIEYTGCNCQSLEKQLLANGAVSFNSGWDGGGEDGNHCPEQHSHRLRENRLRINGMKGLKSLYILLEWMKNNNCKIDIQSGMHYHIDCTDVAEKSYLSNNRIEIYYERIRNIILNLSGITNTAVARVYEIPKAQCICDNNFDLHKFGLLPNGEFFTIEWRCGTPILQYKTLVLQILVAIHVTECSKYQNKNPNDKYLWMLGEISDGARNLPAKQY